MDLTSCSVTCEVEWSSCFPSLFSRPQPSPKLELILSVIAFGPPIDLVGFCKLEEVHFTLRKLYSLDLSVCSTLRNVCILVHSREESRLRVTRLNTINLTVCVDLEELSCLDVYVCLRRQHEALGPFLVRSPQGDGLLWVVCAQAWMCHADNIARSPTKNGKPGPLSLRVSALSCPHGQSGRQSLMPHGPRCIISLPTAGKSGREQL